MALTRRQKQVLDLIAKFVDDNGYSPSYEELAQGLNLASLATVHKHISALTDQELSEARLQPEPLAGARSQISAGEPPPRGTAPRWRFRCSGASPPDRRSNPSSSAPRSALPISSDTPDTFALEVRGESMIGDHICDGDMVLLERVSEVRDGDIVVALVEGPRPHSNGFIANREAKSGCSPLTPRCSRSSCRPRTYRYKAAC